MVFGPARPAVKTLETCHQITKVVVEILPRDNVIPWGLNLVNYDCLRATIISSTHGEIKICVSYIMYRGATKHKYVYKYLKITCN